MAWLVVIHSDGVGSRMVRRITRQAKLCHIAVYEVAFLVHPASTAVGRFVMTAVEVQHYFVGMVCVWRFCAQNARHEVRASWSCSSQSELRDRSQDAAARTLVTRSWAEPFFSMMNRVARGLGTRRRAWRRQAPRRQATRGQVARLLAEKSGRGTSRNEEFGDEMSLS